MKKEEKSTRETASRYNRVTKNKSGITLLKEK